MDILTLSVFRGRRDVRLELDGIPRLIQRVDCLDSYTRRACIKSIRESLPLRVIVKEILENIESMLDLTIVGHTVRVSHPEAFCPNDVESRLGGRVVDQFCG